MTDTAKEPFTIQAGKRYNRADGGISGVLINDAFAGMFFDGEHERTYEKNGLHAHDNSNVDLISEYIEPFQSVEELLTTEVPDGPIYIKEPTAGSMRSGPFQERPYATIKEPQDEWGPWIGWNGGECPVDDHVMVQFQVKSETRFTAESDTPDRAGDCGWEWDSDGDGYGDIIAYRIKKEPEAVETPMWVHENGKVYDFGKASSREVTITTQGNNISIKWAGKGAIK